MLGIAKIKKIYKGMYEFKIHDGENGYLLGWYQIQTEDIRQVRRVIRRTYKADCARNNASVKIQG